MESVARFDFFAPLLYQTARGADAELLVLGYLGRKQYIKRSAVICHTVGAVHTVLLSMGGPGGFWLFVHIFFAYDLEFCPKHLKREVRWSLQVHSRGWMAAADDDNCFAVTSDRLRCTYFFANSIISKYPFQRYRNSHVVVVQTMRIF